MNVTLTPNFILSAVALISGILMVVGGRWSHFPFAAIGIIALAIVQLGIIK